jgi:hypothetical protein
MGTLKARVSGVWVPVTQGGLLIPGGVAGEVLVKQSAVNGDAAWGALVQSGTYTPTLTNIAVGTGGSAQNSADYLFVGGPSVGDKGILMVSGRIVFGTTGATLPGVTNNPKASLPVGFNLLHLATTFHVGDIRAAVSGAYDGRVLNDSANGNLVQLFFTQLPVAVANGGVIVSPPSPTFPSTWAAGSEIRWNVSQAAVRV